MPSISAIGPANWTGFSGAKPDGPQRAQFLMATYDGNFVNHLRAGGFSGRYARLSAVDAASGSVKLTEAGPVAKASR